MHHDNDNDDDHPSDKTLPFDGAIPIPADWSGEQALAVFDFLQDVLTAIWTVHDMAMVPLIMQAERDELHACQHDGRHHDEEDEDDIPF